MVAVFIQLRRGDRPIAGGRRGSNSAHGNPVAERVGTTATRVCRIDCGDLHRYVLVCATTLFSGRYLMKRAIVLGALLIMGVLSVVAVGLQAPGGQRGPNVAEVQKVKDNLYMLTGGGGNTAVFVTDAGVVVVDTKLAGWGQPILDKIKTISNKPVVTIINTHSHPDHVGSNEAFPATVDFVAQEITKSNMEKQDAFQGDKAKFLPKKTFKDKMTLGKGKDEIDLFYFGRGHTGGDAWVLVPAIRVLHAGDML